MRSNQSISLVFIMFLLITYICSISLAFDDYSIKCLENEQDSFMLTTKLNFVVGVLQFVYCVLAGNYVIHSEPLLYEGSWGICC